jgi:polyhydroxyalkanoate synthesis regulator phasin
MPQPKRQSSRSRSTGARKSGSSASTKKRATAARKTAQQRKATAPRRASAAKKKAAPSQRSKTTAARGSASTADEARRNVQSAIEALSHGVVITRDRLQEVMDDAVSRGRMTRVDANAVVQDVFKRGRKQTDELRKQAEALRADLEQLLGRAGGELEKRATDARKRAMRAGAGDRALREVDRARRVAGLGRFPILNYEDLTAAQIAERLDDLSPAELRKVRDYERRHANRKSVLNTIEKALG